MRSIRSSPIRASAGMSPIQHRLASLPCTRDHAHAFRTRCPFRTKRTQTPVKTKNSADDPKPSPLSLTGECRNPVSRVPCRHGRHQQCQRVTDTISHCCQRDSFSNGQSPLLIKLDWENARICFLHTHARSFDSSILHHMEAGSALYHCEPEQASLSNSVPPSLRSIHGQAESTLPSP